MGLTDDHPKETAPLDAHFGDPLASANRVWFIGEARSRKRALGDRRLALGSVMLAAALATAGCHKSTASAGKPVPVATTRVTSGEVAISRIGLGQIQALNTAIARAQVAGLIVDIQFKEGQTIGRGHPIAQIDPRPFQATLAQDEANVARDQANLNTAEADLQRYIKVAPQGLISEQQLQTQRGQVAQLRSVLAADQAAARSARLQLGFASIRAPIAGVTGLRLIDVGNLVGPNDPQGVVTVSQIQPIAALFTLPQSDLPAIRSAMVSAGAPGLQVEIYAQGQDNQTLDVGRLALINNQVNLASGTITLKAISPNAKKLLWPGEFVDARLILRREPNGLRVPSSVVQQGAGGLTFAWVVSPDQTVAQRPIKVGGTQGRDTVVESGLTAGEEVVTDGQFALTPGAHVVRVSRAAAQTPPMKNTSQDNIELVP